MQLPCTALETSFLQYSLDQEIAKWSNIVSLIIDNPNWLTNRKDEFKDFKHFKYTFKYCDRGQTTDGGRFLYLLKALRPLAIDAAAKFERW